MTSEPTRPAGAESRHDDISRRAYARYDARGRTDGDDLADWFSAEEEIRGEDEAQAGPGQGTR